MSSMITHNVTQGSQEWLELRAKFHTASEANAMMGSSSYLSRTQLLDQKKSGTSPEPNDYEKKLFDLGHKVEEMARPIIEKLIDEDLFPVVASKDNLLASYDGLTLMGDIGFEHKLWNEKLAEIVKQGMVPDTHVWQLEQQLLVGDVEKILFAVSDGTAEKMVYCWYESDPIKRKQLLAGWEKFDEDLKSHTVGVEKIEGKNISDLMQLSVVVSGKVLENNLNEFAEAANKTIDSISTELTTDQHFADAEKAIKWCKNVETTLGKTKTAILQQSADINAVLDTLEQISNSARAKRLELDKLVKSQKEQIKLTVLTNAKNAVLEHLQAQKYRVEVEYSIETAIKGKKTLSSMEDAAFNEATRAKAAIDLVVTQIDDGIAYIVEAAKGHEFLFNDKETLATQFSGEYLQDEVKQRIESYEQQQANKVAEADASPAAKAEVKRMLDQAARQNEAKKVQASKADQEQTVSAEILNEALHFNHAALAQHLGFTVASEYTKEHVSSMMLAMIDHLNGVAFNLGKVKES
ncbi:YqaJ viral recombinase family protein [Acinetobacter proteolyticus]|uniref:Heme peroxidase n=1 Tax=Acinetobacter proteolyticus TaxID=1776741 RepID=A0A2N0WID8_9GAMM|nr:YqaJ viral recombinase family protein [Acinetobacter proteolyticus]PKF35531.1 Heme peroxidase [Acinetobacter proteolyticus]